MIDKLIEIKNRFEEVGQLLSQPETVKDQKRFQQLSKEYRDLEKVVKKYDLYQNALDGIQHAKEVLQKEKDAELRELAKMEIDELEPKRDAFEDEIKELLMPKDPNDEKNAVLEIRAGTGGDEAAIFAGDLWRMYQRFCERRGYKFLVVDVTEGTAGGYKEVITSVEGEGAYGLLKYESGVHRVQRVPDTEQQGRVHTSAITVAILPEAEDVDIKIEAKDLRIDTFCSSGPGGQSVNTTYSAVRITHLPTNTVVSCQDEKSQIKNREKGMRVLRARLYEQEMERQQQALAKERKAQVGSGDRSEKIRTYNFPQNRMTDHRIGLTNHQLAEVMEGRLQPTIDALIAHYQAEKLKNESAGVVA